MGIVKIIFLSLLLTFIIASDVLAQTATESAQTLIEVNYENINPSDGIDYSWKRLGEKIELFFSFSPLSKIGIYEKHLNKRLAELKYIIEKKQMHKFEDATTRYSTTAGLLAEQIKKNNSLENEEYNISKLLKSHIPIIEKLMTTYDVTTAEWRFVKQDADSLKIYISQLK